MAAPLAAKLALTAAKSKTGRRILAGIVLTVLCLPVALVGIPVSLATAGAVAFSNQHHAGGGDSDGSGGGAGVPVCGGAAECQVSDDAQEVAQQILAYQALGKVSWLDVRFRQQVQAYADGGTVSPNCTIDTRILQVIVLAVQREGSVGISSINRRCTGQTPGAGRASFHWKGKAVDFYSLGGTVVRTAHEPQPLDLIQFLGPIVPKGSGVGQVQCRPAVPLGNFHTFPDSCNHQHVQLSDDTAPLHLPTPTGRTD